MFKALSMLGSVALLAGCSSSYVSTNYVDDVVIQKNSSDMNTQIVGKQIVPIDLLENNLALSVSALDVVANVGNDSSVASTVNFEIEYNAPKTDAQQSLSHYDLVTINDTLIEVNTVSSSKSCAEDSCLMKQSLSFPIATDLLINGQQDGVLFLLQSSNDDKPTLETMIPGRYLNALFTN